VELQARSLQIRLQTRELNETVVRSAVQLWPETRKKEEKEKESRPVERHCQPVGATDRAKSAPASWCRCSCRCYLNYPEPNFVSFSFLHFTPSPSIFLVLSIIHFLLLPCTVKPNVNVATGLSCSLIFLARLLRASLPRYLHHWPSPLPHPLSVLLERTLLSKLTSVSFLCSAGRRSRIYPFHPSHAATPRLAWPGPPWTAHRYRLRLKKLHATAFFDPTILLSSSLDLSIPSVLNVTVHSQDGITQKKTARQTPVLLRASDTTCRLPLVSFLFPSLDLLRLLLLWRSLPPGCRR
jgi:hypothetical protein